MDCHHLNFTLLIFHNLREWGFANLALELCEVIGEGKVINLFFYFAIDPLFKASHMDFGNTTFAFTWRN